MGRFKKVSAVAGILVFLLIVNVAGARAAKAADIEIDKIETDLFPDIIVTMKVVSNGAPVSGLTVLDFKLNEEIRHKVLSDETFIIQPFMVNEDAGGSGKYTILYKAQPLNKSDREDHRIFKAEVSHRLPQAGVIRQGPSATLKGKENLSGYGRFPGCKDMLAKIYATENKSGDLYRP